MKLINAKQVALLLDIPLTNAACKIYHAKGEEPKYNDKGKFVEPNPNIKVDLLSKKLGIDFEFYLAEIKENYLKRSATRGWIMNYPLTKLKPGKDGSLPKVVKPPAALVSLLSQEDVQLIVSMWTERYGHFNVRFSVA